MEAKKRFSDLYRDKEGFVGIGVGQLGDRYILRVYVEKYDCPLVDELRNMGFIFEDFIIEVFESGEIKAQ